MSEEDEILHSKRGPSTAHRWRLCPGSVRLSEGLPNTAGIEAAYGTVFHEHAANCLEFGLDPQDFVGDKIEVPPHGMIEFDQTMADKMLAGLDYVRALADVPGATMLVEKRVSLENWVGKGEFGTTDCAVINPAAKRLVTFDWKYGAGVPVSPEENDQAMLYTLGIWDDYARTMFFEALAEEIGWDQAEMADAAGAPWEDEIEVWVVIEQPRAPGGGGVWKTTMGHILHRGAQIREDAKETENPFAAVVPGEKQCKFCPAARYNVCETRVRTLVEELGADFDDLEADFRNAEPLQLVNARALSPEARSQLLLHRSQIEALLKQLHEEAYKDAGMGRPIPGMKLVDGRAMARKWKDPMKAEVVIGHVLGADGFKIDLISPAQAEELMGKAAYRMKMAPFVQQGESKPQLVPESDKRAALASVHDDFDEDDLV